MAAKSAQSSELAPAELREAGSTSSVPVRAQHSHELNTDTGRTSIADHVVAKIAGMAAREVRGVHHMGGGAGRAFDAVRERIPGSTSTSTAARGVAVEVGERQAAVDINLVVEYGVSIPDLAAGVRRNVISGVERMTGLEVTEVNVTVDDIHLPDEEESRSAAEPRVR